MTRTITLVAVVLTVLLAGCAGWGTDGPNGGEEPEADAPDEELEESDEHDESEQVDSDDGGDSDIEESDNGDVDADESDQGDSAEESDDTDADADEQVDEPDVDESTDDSDEADTDDSNEQDDTDEQDNNSSDTDNADEPAGDEPTDEAPSDGDDNGATDDDGDQNGDEVETHTLTVTSAPDTEVRVNAEGNETPDFSEETRTDEDGVATFDVPDGFYVVDAITQGPDPEANTTVSVAVDGGDEDVAAMVEGPPNDDDPGDEPGNGYDEFYEQTLTVTVVDQDGNPVEGELVEHGPPTEEPNQSDRTDENGQVVITSNTSDPTDATMLSYFVDGQEYSGSAHVDGPSAEVEIETNDNDDDDDDNGDEDDELLAVV